jgi:hypothetical protein
MNLNSLVVDTIKNLGVPVSFQNYTGKEPTYITFFEYNQQGEEYADDTEIGTGHFIQIDIWSKSDYIMLVESVKNSLIKAGFWRLSEIDLYENDTNIYHKGMRFFYLEEV